MKVKPRHTLDLVVLAAEWGHGRRTGTLSNMEASELRALADAKQITVLYDPDDPSANTAWIE